MLAGVLVLLCVGFVLGRLTRVPRQAPGSERRILYYVDPMHPAYRSDKPGIAPDCGMALEPVYAGDAAPIPTQLQPGAVALSPERQQLIGMRVAVASPSGGKRIIRTTGRVLPEDNRLYRIQSGFEGWVDSLADTPPGTLVKKNQVLAVLYGPEIRSAESNYVGFMAGIDRLRQGMAQNELKSLDESRHVNEEQLRLLGMGDEEMDHLATSHHIGSSLNLVAPGNGIVLSRSITPRQRFEKSTELYRIADLSRVWIAADVHGDEGDFRPGTRVKVNVPELGAQIEAVVTSTMPLFDDSSRTLKIRLEAQNPGLRLRPDMYVDVEFESSMPDGLAIPADAVIDSGTRKIVYVETAEGVFEPRSVQVSPVTGDQVIVEKGIAKGERVVIAGNFLLDSESRMRAGTAGSGMNTSNAVSESVSAGPSPIQPVSSKYTENRDPVCGMTLHPGQASIQQDHQGKKYSFCSEACRKKFLAHPEKYVPSQSHMAAARIDRRSAAPAAQPND